MAFDPAGLERKWRRKDTGYTEWHYQTPDPSIHTDADYWNPAAGRLKVADRITISAGYGPDVASCDGEAVVHEVGVGLTGEAYVRVMYLGMWRA